MKKGIIAVSYGIADSVERGRTLDLLLAQLTQQYPKYRIACAYTGSHPIAKMRANGEVAQTLSEVLEAFAAEEIDEVYLFPTHLIYGSEYRKIVDAAAFSDTKFRKIIILEPLFEKASALVSLIAEEVNPSKEEHLLLMLHGSRELPQVYRQYERFDGTTVSVLSMDSSLAPVLDTLQRIGCDRVVLAPLTFVCGKHAKIDLAAEDSDSVRRRLEREGITVRTVLKGLGAYPTIREWMIKRLQERMREEGTDGDCSMDSANAAFIETDCG